MKTFLLFASILILTGFSQLENPYRHIDNIEQKAQYWFDNHSGVIYSRIVRHETHETEDGGKVCYRAIHMAFVDIICLGWKYNEPVQLSKYRLANHDVELL